MCVYQIAIKWLQNNQLQAGKLNAYYGTYRFRPIPIASVATSTLHAFAGLLKIAACASFVPGNIT